jgi:hypothetical protein
MAAVVAQWAEALAEAAEVVVVAAVEEGAKKLMLQVNDQIKWSYKKGLSENHLEAPSKDLWYHLLTNSNTVRSTHIPYSNIFTIPFLKHSHVISRVDSIACRINDFKCSNFHNHVSII